MRFKIFGVFFIFLLCFSSIGYSQSIKDRMFYTYGYSLFGEILPAFHSTNRSGYEQHFIFGVGFDSRVRLNLLNINDNNSVSLDLIPEIGFVTIIELIDNDSPRRSFAGFIPIYLSYNTGAGSTYDTDKNFGMGISGGFEYQYVYNNFGTKGSKGVINSGYLYPSVQLSFRYWKDNSNALRELTLKYGISSNDPVFKGDDISKSFIASITWSKYLNY